MLSFSAVKLVKFPLGSTNKVKVKSSPLIVKFIFHSFKDSPVDVRVVVIRVAGVAQDEHAICSWGYSLFALSQDVITAIGQESSVPSVCQCLYGRNAQHPHFVKALGLSILMVVPIISDMLRE